MKEIDAIKQALAAGPTPGSWKAHCYEKACHYEDEEVDGYFIEGATYKVKESFDWQDKLILWACVIVVILTVMLGGL